MNSNQSIELQLVKEDGQPVALGNVLVFMQFFMRGEFRYMFNVGRTDEMGHLLVSYEAVEAERLHNAKFHLMDYNTKLEQCDDGVNIMIPSEKELRERYNDVLRYYKRPPPWAEDWPSNAQVMVKQQLVTLTGQLTRVEIICESRP